jgi:hypothetical protein
MRRLLPLLLCVAASTGLAACDHEPDDGLTPDQEQALYDAMRAAPNANPGGLADGNVELRRPAGDGGGGADIVIFDIVDAVARDSDGLTIQTLTDSSIMSPTGQVLCTKASSGVFMQLRDSDGDVLLSVLGPLVFEGQPALNGKNAFQQLIELASHLRFSYDFDTVVEGFASYGDGMVEASAPIQYASNWRKLVIASLVDGYCGSEGLPANIQ